MADLLTAYFAKTDAAHASGNTLASKPVAPVAPIKAVKTAGTLSAENQANRDGSQVPMPAPTGEAVTARDIKPTRDSYFECTDFHENLFAVLFDSAELLNLAVESQRTRARNALEIQYGDIAPTYDQFRADRDALRILSLERGLVDDQYVRKAYNAAVKELFGALPVSDTPAAIAKRAQRPVAGPRAVKAAEPDSVPANATELPVADSSAIGQFIAKYGAAQVLIELAKILATEKATALDAKTLIAVASHFGTKAA